jgi:outer membrane protein assembly factor BamA
MGRTHATILFTLLFAACAAAQDADSRAAEITVQQQEKAAHVEPDKPGRIERALLEFRERNYLERFTAGAKGFHLKLGGMASGSGFAAGPGYRRTDLLDGQLTIDLGYQASFRGSQKAEFQAWLPRLANSRAFAGFHAVRHNYPTLSYYGSGPDSRKTGRGNFRLEDAAFDATAGLYLTRRLTAGVSAGYLVNNTGPGTDSRYASAEQLYSPSQAPGIDSQSNFLRTSTFTQYDWRDNPDGPRRGGNYFAQFADYRDRTFGAANFRRLDMEAQHYVSILNQRRVFAVRAKSALTFRDNRQTLPFYMQPTLGGSEDLRGYRPFRFRDNNLVVFNGEYRWEVFSGLDMALFADAGKVFPHKSEFNLKHLESDAGFGFRFNARNRTFLRLDFAFSHEGYQIWVKFGNLFKRGPVHTSSSMGDF